MTLRLENELKTVDLGDKRLDKRLHKICEAFSLNPEAILSHAMSLYHECKAAYRFFENPRVTPEKILSSHQNAIAERMTDKDEVILEIQDSSALNFSTHRKTTGLGPLGSMDGPKGLELHAALVIAETGLPLGIGSIKIWSRKEKRTQTRGTLFRKVRWEEKESFKWYRATEEVDRIDFKGKTRILIADREADFYELHNAIRKDKRLQVIRLKNNRKVKEGSQKIQQYVDQKEKAGNFEIEVMGKGGYNSRESRRATIEVKFTEITMRCETPCRKEDLIGMTVIQAKEIKKPSSKEEPIEWYLLTNVPINTFNEAQRVINWYTKRWEIEDYFKLLKGAMKIEEARLETREGLQKLITILAIVSYRLFWINRMSRVECKATALNFFSKGEVLLIAKRLKASAPEQLRVEEMIKGIAGLAGYWGRKGDGPPGVIRLWEGWRRLMQMAIGAELYQRI